MAGGERTAEAIKREIGSAYPPEDELKAEVRGRELATGMPKTVTISAERCDPLRDAVSGERSRGAARSPDTPPELATTDRARDAPDGRRRLVTRDAARSRRRRPSRARDENPLETSVPRSRRALGSLEKLREHGVLLS